MWWCIHGDRPWQEKRSHWSWPVLPTQGISEGNTPCVGENGRKTNDYDQYDTDGSDRKSSTYQLDNVCLIAYCDRSNEGRLIENSPSISCVSEGGRARERDGQVRRPFIGRVGEERFEIRGRAEAKASDGKKNRPSELHDGYLKQMM